MKKKYISPELEVIEAEAQQALLTGSVILVDGTTDDASGADAPAFGEWRF